MNYKKIARFLAEPFPVYWHEVKPGAGGQQGQALALPFVPWHHYQARLDRVVGWQNWSIAYKLLDQETVYAELTICGITKGDVGEAEDEEAPSNTNQKRRGANPLFAGVAQAFRRASAAFGLGRYLYELDRYYARAEGKRITEKADEIVFKLLEQAGLDPYQRHRRQIAEAASLEEMTEIAELIAFSASVRDLKESEIAKLKEQYREQKLKVGSSSSGSSSPATPAPAPIPAPSSPPAATPTTPATPAFAPSEKAAELAGHIAEIEEGIKENDLMYKTLKMAIGDAGRNSEITPKEAAELLDRLRTKTKKPASGMRPADYDKDEERIRGKTTEQREQQYSEEIQKADRKLLEALGPEIEKDRSLVSSAVVRLKKKISDRLVTLGPSKEEAERARAAIENAKKISPTPPKMEVSAAVRSWEAKIRACKDEIALDQLVGDSARASDLSTRDLDYLDPIVVERREGIKRAAAIMAEHQRPLI